MKKKDIISSSFKKEKKKGEILKNKSKSKEKSLSIHGSCGDIQYLRRSIQEQVKKSTSKPHINRK